MRCTLVASLMMVQGDPQNRTRVPLFWGFTLYLYFLDRLVLMGSVFPSCIYG